MQGGSDVPKSIFKCLEIYPALKLADREKPTPDVAPAQPIPTKIARGVYVAKFSCLITSGS